MDINGNFFLTLPLITSWLLLDPSLTGVSISSLRHGDFIVIQTNITVSLQCVPKKNHNATFSVTQLIVAPGTPAAVKSVFKDLACIFRGKRYKIKYYMFVTGALFTVRFLSYV